MNKILQNPVQRQLFTIGSIVLTAALFGTLGYMTFENYQPVEALYMTVITLATVGFKEVQPLSTEGQIFTIFLIMVGVTILAYASTQMVGLLASGEIQAEIRARRRKRMVSKLQNHDIVCGFGRVGEHIAAELNRLNRQFVVIDYSPEVVGMAEGRGFAGILGDASSEETLIRAGLERARSLFAVVDSDAANVFIVLTARALRPDIVIVTRVNEDSAEPKLRRAGANEVISPYVIGGRRMVHYVERPGVVDFLDVVINSPHLELQMEEFVITDTSPLKDKTVQEAQLRTRTGINVLYSFVPGQPITTDMEANGVFVEGMHLIVLGTMDQLERLSELATCVKGQHQAVSASNYVEPFYFGSG